MSVHGFRWMMGIGLVALGGAVPLACVFSPMDYSVSAGEDGGPACSGARCGTGGCPRCAAGERCESDEGCANGLACAMPEGVCCNQPCNGACMACVGSKTGKADGVCASVCPIQDPTTCGTTGACGADGACVVYAAGISCAAASCGPAQQGGFEETGPRTCDGMSSCASPVTTSCGLYGCDGPACRERCSVDEECAQSAYCVNQSECVAKLDNGDLCDTGRDAQCKSGHCANYMCCDTACAGTCVACSASKTGVESGTCANIPAGEDPDGECDDGKNCDGHGACEP